MMEVTKTNKNIGLILVSVLVVSAISGGIILTTYASDDRGIERFNRGACNFGDLSDIQREEIKDMMQDMYENGASREEVKTAVESKLTEWGIDVPEFEGEFKKGVKGRHPPFLNDLTEEQRKEIKDMVQDMHENGASREEVKTAVESKLTKWGIDVLTFEQSRLPPWWSELTDEQKEEIITIKEELIEAGASKEEIRDAFKMKLEEWNIEIPKKLMPTHQ
jgi:predicted transcriptional regulator